jgi:hypothetical protein
LLKKAGINRLAVAAHRDRAVGAAAARFERAGTLTIGYARGATWPAFTAPWKRDHDRVARRKVGDGRSNLLDNAGAFMAANNRIGQVREIPIAGMQVGVAHAAGRDPHKHFVGERRREVERLDLKRS